MTFLDTQRYFHKETSFGIDSYEDFIVDDVHEDLKTKTQSLNGLGEEHAKLADFITEALNAQTIEYSRWTAKLWCKCVRSALAAALIYLKVYKRSNSTETLQATSDFVDVSDFSSPTEVTVKTTLPPFSLAQNDRVKIEIWMKYIGVRTIDYATVTFYADTSANNSRMDFEELHFVATPLQAKSNYKRGVLKGRIQT